MLSRRRWFRHRLWLWFWLLLYLLRRWGNFPACHWRRRNFLFSFWCEFLFYFRPHIAQPFFLELPVGLGHRFIAPR